MRQSTCIAVRSLPMRRWWYALVDSILIFFDEVAEEGLIRLLGRKLRRGARRIRRFVRRVRFPPSLVIFVLGAGIGTALWLVPLWLAADLLTTPPMAGISDVAETRTALVQVVGASGLLAGLSYTARTFRLNHAVSVVDRYARAVEQLGHSSDGVRLAGVLELELMADKALVDDVRVARLLRTFIIEQVGDTRNISTATLADRPRESLVAALRAMGAHPYWPWSAQEYQKANLQHLDLSYVNFSYATLQDSQWNESILQRAIFVKANLTSGKFINANLADSSLVGANLSGADLSGANLSRADLRDTVLLGANLEGAILDATELNGAKLHRGALTNRQWDGVSDAGKIVWVDQR